MLLHSLPKGKVKKNSFVLCFSNKRAMVKGYLGLAVGQQLYISRRHIHVVGDSDHPSGRTLPPRGAFHKSRNDDHRTVRGDNSCLPHMAENNVKCQPSPLRLQSLASSRYLNFPYLTMLPFQGFLYSLQFPSNPVHFLFYIF